MEQTFAGLLYLDMLNQWLLPHLQADRQVFIYQKYRAPPHFHHDVREYLDSTAPSRSRSAFLVRLAAWIPFPSETAAMQEERLLYGTVKYHVLGFDVLIEWDTVLVFRGLQSHLTYLCDFFLKGLCPRSCVRPNFATWFSTAAWENQAYSHWVRPSVVGTSIAWTELHYWWTYETPVRYVWNLDRNLSTNTRVSVIFVMVPKPAKDFIKLP